MTTLPYQPVPTATQQRELERWVSRHYPVRQYEQAQALISPVEAAGVACCATDRDEDEAPALLGLIDALSDEFGPLWPVWAAAYFVFIAAGLVGLVAIVWSIV